MELSVLVKKFVRNLPHPATLVLSKSEWDAEVSLLPHDLQLLVEQHNLFEQPIGVTLAPTAECHTNLFRWHITAGQVIEYRAANLSDREFVSISVHQYESGDSTDTQLLEWTLAGCSLTDYTLSKVLEEPPPVYIIGLDPGAGKTDICAISRLGMRYDR